MVHGVKAGIVGVGLGVTQVDSLLSDGLQQVVLGGLNLDGGRHASIDWGMGSELKIQLIHVEGCVHASLGMEFGCGILGWVDAEDEGSGIMALQGNVEMVVSLGSGFIVLWIV